MAALTAAEVANIGNATLDNYIKGKAHASHIQDKPLLSALMSKQKTFGGAKDNIVEQVKFATTTSLSGYEGSDTVTYGNPTNIKQASYPWKELHAGIEVTHSELKHQGIAIVESGGNARVAGRGDMAVTLTDIYEDKLQDMSEGWAASFNTMLWKDGTQDSKEVAGIQYLIADDPTTGTVGGLDRASFAKWRNRTLVSGSKVTASASTQALTKALKAEVRQLRRYGGTPNLILCGSDFMAAVELEANEKSTYTQSNDKSIDISSQIISIQGIGTFQYDPTLDDLSRSKFAYFIDTKNICLRPMKGQDRVVHNPARPHDQYTFYHAMTWTGGLTAKQLNGCGVYEVA